MKKIFSVILSLVILITSMGFTVSSHFCGGKRIKTELGVTSSNVSCGMEKITNHCESGDQMKSNCCQDQFQTIQMNGNYLQQLTPVNFTQDFAILFVGMLFEFLPSTTSQTTFYKAYLPPPLIRDIPVMVQSFLI